MRSWFRTVPSGRGCATLVAVLGLAAVLPASAQSLRGTHASMDRQVREAKAHHFTYLDTPGDVYRFVAAGYLVPIRGNRDFQIKPGVPFPYARPEVQVFLERLGEQYRAACGDPLVVTSLTRPRDRQPRNASPRSVHPTGMAVDLRVSWSRQCRGWIEGVLLGLEEAGVLEANREYHPPHYHVALFPQPYAEYVAALESDGVTESTIAFSRYTVQRGDTLWRIAHSHGTSVERIKSANAIRTNSIRPGQVLEIPGGE